MNYDRWKESGPVDALTAAETQEGGSCPLCGTVEPDGDYERGRCDDPRIP